MDLFNFGIIGILIVLNVVQFWFWSRDHHKLIDKLMSRNYADYVHTAQAQPIQQPVKAVETDEITDDVVLTELNRALGR